MPHNRKGININASIDKIIKNPKSKLNFKVQDEDRIIIVPHPYMYVSIAGMVKKILKFVDGKRVRYYLSLAGGY